MTDYEYWVDEIVEILEINKIQVNDVRLESIVKQVMASAKFRIEKM